MKKIALILGFALAIIACSTNNEEDKVADKNFDRTALLTNWADNIIIPSYNNYKTKLQTLHDNAAIFVANPSQTNLKTLRTAWIESYKAYQYVSMYNFGKAEEVNLTMVSNTYPTDVTGIVNNITNGTYNLSLTTQYATQGLPALDYLLNGLATTDADIIVFYTTDVKATNYKKYLTDITTKLKTTLDVVLADWNSGYRTAYIANSGTSVTSAVNKTTNAFVKNMEKDIRTGKLGIPGGVFSAGLKHPEKVEAFYKKDISKELLIIALQAQQDFFNGKAFNSNSTGTSLKSYLDHLNAIRDGKKMSDIINTQFTNISNSNNALLANFSEQITLDNSKIIAAYTSLQQNVVYTKLDMMQALNITIDYVDGDGD